MSAHPFDVRAPIIRFDAHRRRAQRGVSMIVVLLFMLAIGMLGITGWFLAQSQLRLVGNLQFQDLAFAQAESTLAIAEQWLVDGANSRSPDFRTYNPASKGLYPAGALDTLKLDPRSMAWGEGNSIGPPTGRYVIELVGSGVRIPGASLQVGQGSAGRCEQVDLFRVVAWSSSIRGSERIVESMIAREGCP